MQVSEVMHKGVSTVQIGDSIKKVANLMKREDIGAVPVFKNERAVGFVTDRDIVVSCIADGKKPEDSISLAMKHQVYSVHEKDEISLASKIMRENQVSRLLVLDEGEKPVGMVSIHDIFQNTQDLDLKIKLIDDIKR